MKKIIALILAFLVFFAAAPVAAGLAPFEVDASAALVMDFETGQVLYAFNADEALPPASITKLMGMYLIFEALEQGSISLEDEVTASKNVTMNPDSSQIFFTPGETLTVLELLQSVAIISANDAGIALAEHIAGSESAFVQMMNDKAIELGLENSNFLNAHGLDAPGHLMSARDIAILSQAIIRDFPEVLEYSALRHLRLQRETRYVRQGYFDLHSTFTTLIGWRSIDGLKTGWTQPAGRCITATGYQNGRRVIAVVLGTENIGKRDAVVKTLLNYGFDQFNRHTFAEAQAEIEEITIANAREQQVSVFPKKDVAGLIPRGMSMDELLTETEINSGLKAPLKAGDTVGEYRVFRGEELVASAPLVVQDDVQRANFIVRSLRFISSALTQLGSWIMDKLS